MTWCNRCGYDYGLTSHACGGSGSFPTPSLSVTSIDFTNFHASGGNGSEPQFSLNQAQVEQLIEAIAVKVEGLDKYDEDFENGYPAYKSPDGYWVPYHEVLEAIRSTKI